MGKTVGWCVETPKTLLAQTSSVLPSHTRLAAYPGSVLEKDMTAPAFQLKEKTAIAIAAAAFLCGCPALAQYSANGFGTTTLRDPLIPGASNAPAFTPAPLGAPP